MANILHLTGQLTSDKFGGLERWYCSLADLLSDEFQLILAFEESLPISIVMQIFTKHNIQVVIINKNDLARFPDFIKVNNVKIVHCHFENLLSFLTVAKKNGCKTFWTVHMDLYYLNNSDWKKSLKLRLGVLSYIFKIKRIVKNIDRIYFVSDLLQKNYVDFFGIKKDKTTTNYLGINDDFFKIKIKIQNLKKKLEKNKSCIITCIAFLDEIKGIDIILEAAEILKERNLDFHINIVGGNPGSEKIEDSGFYKLAKNKGILNFISFIGISQNVKEYLELTDIYIQPSRSEALGISIMEAMSYSLPIIGSNVGGIPELVENNKNGFLIRKKDSSILADKIEILIRDENLRISMGEKSYSLITDKKFNQKENQLIIKNNYLI